MPGLYNQNRQPALYASTAVLLYLATTAVFFRLLARRKSAASFWWDDYTIAVALVLYCCLTICFWLQACLGGSGRHTVSAGGPVDVAMQVKFQKLSLAIQIFYFSTSVTFKTSLILLYHRVFGVVRWFRILLLCAECIVACYFVVCLFTAIFECTPVVYYWDKAIPRGSCINETDFYRWNGVANLLIDFMILCLTFPMVWRLKIETRQKATLSGVFLLGTFVFMASIIRVTTFEQLQPMDETYTGIATAIWTEVEQSLGIVCACLPCLRPLFGTLLMGSSSHGTIITGNANPSSRDLQLVKRGHERTAGFARLAEEHWYLPETVNKATAAGKGGPRGPQGPRGPRGQEGILKRESFELSYNAAEGL